MGWRMNVKERWQYYATRFGLIASGKSGNETDFDADVPRLQV
jgi:hypothetical protein